ncbi:MAG: response regulator [Candidatus Andersenbacteria bacterium]|nr:response regulator [Candidatus Andersenbacteria bacterium]MBI3251112.1 response regulator [Candidatus Andersenbacteria bacterium]
MADQTEKSKLKILMIDDDLMLLKLYEMTARTHEEITFLTATNTVEGDKFARQQRPDVVLLDLILGKEPNTPVTEVDKNHGFNFLIMLKGDPEIKDIPVIILSNLDTKQDHDRARELQAADYIVKAKTTPEEVLTAAKGAADIAGAERRIREAQDKLE